MFSSLNRPLSTLPALALGLSLALGLAAPAAHAAPAQKAAAKKAPAKSKAKAKSSKGKTAAKAAAVAAPLVVPAADAAQMEVAQRVYYGVYNCEFGKTIDVNPSTEHPGYAQLKTGGRDYLFKPVMSSTGAIRLEDLKGEMLLLQIAFKSMLMNVKTGERVLDGCESTQQAQLKSDYEKLPEAERTRGNVLQPGNANPAAAAAASAAAAANAAATNAPAAAAGAFPAAPVQPVLPPPSFPVPARQPVAQ